MKNCKDCHFLRQEWHYTWDNHERTKLQPDTYCWICDVFKSPDGYCDFFEERLDAISS